MTATVPSFACDSTPVDGLPISDEVLAALLVDAASRLGMQFRQLADDLDGELRHSSETLIGFDDKVTGAIAAFAGATDGIGRILAASALARNESRLANWLVEVNDATKHHRTAFRRALAGDRSLFAIRLDAEASESVRRRLATNDFRGPFGEAALAARAAWSDLKLRVESIADLIPNAVPFEWAFHVMAGLGGTVFDCHPTLTPSNGALP